jgi:hypothetical protein
LPKIDKAFEKGNILLQISFFFKKSKLQEEGFATFIFKSFLEMCHQLSQNLSRHLPLWFHQEIEKQNIDKE